jgi:hypothetical protein
MIPTIAHMSLTADIHSFKLLLQQKSYDFSIKYYPTYFLIFMQKNDEQQVQVTQATKQKMSYLKMSPLKIKH